MGPRSTNLCIYGSVWVSNARSDCRCFDYLHSRQGFQRRLFTCVTACTLAGRPEGGLCVEGSGGFVPSTAASTATGWSDPVAGRASQPAEDLLLFTAHPVQRRVIRSRVAFDHAG